MEKGDKVYCYSKFFEIVDKAGFANNTIDKYLDFIHNGYDWISKFLNVNLDNEKVSFNNLWNSFKIILFSIIISLLLLSTIITILILFKFAYSKNVIFEKGNYYLIENVNKNGCRIINNELKGRIFINKGTKSNIFKYFFFVVDNEFEHHFLTVKQLRRNKLKKLSKWNLNRLRI